MERRGFLLVGAVAILGLMPLWVMLIGGTLRLANTRRSVRVRGFCCDGARNGVWQRTSRKRATLTSPRTVSAQGTSMEGKGGTKTRFQVHGAWPAPRGVRSAVSAARNVGFPGPTFLTPLFLAKLVSVTTIFNYFCTVYHNVFVRQDLSRSIFG